MSITNIWKTCLGLLHPSRLLVYLMLLNFGAIDSLKYIDLDSGLLAKLPIAKLIIVNIAIVLSYMAMAAINDYYDLSIDKLTNPNRPLVKGWISPYAMFRLSVILMLSALILVASVQLNLLLLIIIILLIGVFYSAPPIRLRRFFLLSNVSLTIIGLTTMYLGSKLVVGELGLPASNKPYIVVGALFLSASFFKDIKDAKGDRAYGVNTFATWLGEKNAYWFSGVLVVFSLMLLMGCNTLPINVVTVGGLLSFIGCWVIIRNSENLFWMLNFGLCAILIVLWQEG